MTLVLRMRLEKHTDDTMATRERVIPKGKVYIEKVMFQ